MGLDVRNTDDMISEIREQVDEENTETRDDDVIMAIVSRGIREAAHTLAIHYPDALLAVAPLTLVGSRADYDVPPDCFEWKVLYIEIDVPNAPTEVRRRSFRDGTRLFLSGTTPIPWTWELRGGRIHFQQMPTGAFAARLFYVRTPDPAVVPQGRVTSVDTAGQWLVVDTPGKDLSSETDELASYVNVIDWRTGLVKATMQIQSILGGKVTFRGTPLRSSVRGRTISGSLPLVSDPSTGSVAVGADDYLCLSGGSCVPQLPGMMYNYLVDFAVASLSRSLSGGDPTTQLNQSVAAKAKEMVADQWAGNEVTERIKNRSAAWPSATRRLPWPSGS